MSSGNKSKILRTIAMNEGLTMTDLVTRNITQQPRGVFKQTIYQLKHSGDIDQSEGGKYIVTSQGKSYLKATNELPVSEPHDGARLDVCPDCQTVVNLEKHNCPEADPLAEMNEPHDDSADFDPVTLHQDELTMPEPSGDICITLQYIDDEIDCMTALASVMAHFEAADMTAPARTRIMDWFTAKYLC